MREFLERKHYFLVVYLLFLLGFFGSPSIHWHNKFFYAFVVFPYLLTLQKSKLKLFLHSKIWVLSMAFALYLCLTLLWAENVGEDGPLYYLRRPIYLFVFLGVTIELVRRYPKFIDRLFICLCWAGAITGVVSILFYYPDLSFGSRRLGHLADQLQNPIESGGVYGMLMLVAYFGIFKTTSRNGRWLYVAVTPIFAISTVLTQSRGPLGALVVAVLAGSILTRDKKALAGLMLFILVLIALWQIGGFGRRIFERGPERRLELAGKMVKSARGSLVFGRGISTNTRFSLKDGTIWADGHNAYLGTVLYSGLVGLFFLTALICVALWESFRHFLDTRNVTYFALLLFGIICITTGEDKLFTHPDPLWMFFWLPLGLLGGEQVLGRNRPRQAESVWE